MTVCKAFIKGIFWTFACISLFMTVILVGDVFCVYIAKIVCACVIIDALLGLQSIPTEHFEIKLLQAYQPNCIPEKLCVCPFCPTVPLFFNALTILLFIQTDSRANPPCSGSYCSWCSYVSTKFISNKPVNQIFIVSLCSVHLHTRLHTGTDQTDLPTSKPPALHLYPSTSHLLTNWPSFSALVLPACLPTNNQPTAFPLYLL